MRAVIGVLVLLALPALAQAQKDKWERQAQLRLARTSETLIPRGYRARGIVAQGTLFVEESRTIALSIEPDTEYLLAGGCDADCAGLALVVTNPTGYQTDADRGPGVAPVVRIGAGAPQGIHQVTIKMIGCRVSPCRYAMALFQRRARP